MVQSLLFLWPFALVLREIGVFHTWGLPPVAIGTFLVIATLGTFAYALYMVYTDIDAHVIALIARDAETNTAAHHAEADANGEESTTVVTSGGGDGLEMGGEIELTEMQQQPTQLSTVDDDDHRGAVSSETGKPPWQFIVCGTVEPGCSNDDDVAVLQAKVAALNKRLREQGEAHDRALHELREKKNAEIAQLKKSPISRAADR